MARLRCRLEHIVHWLRGFVFGMTTYEMVMTMLKERADREHLFVLISFGDLLGVPILPPYYSLRLLPFIVPLMGTWKRRLLREKDLTDIASMLD
ncbi:MAG: hypothetical protein JXB30_12630 [Anaerolineae bacterium]|nr:hypothetical protein [Anaerolineae bacterium]